ncbi:MAG TPA: cytochrome c oxidase subunit II [Devosia sp.]|nr:cytochrome c oxidase subunit II [Devosia sp.]
MQIAQTVRAAYGVVGCLSLCACTGNQSILNPAGRDASSITTLFWLMVIVGGMIWLLLMSIAVYAVVGARRPKSEHFADRFIIGGGVIFPIVVLALLLVFGLSLLPGWAEDDPADLRVHVSAEQYWWRVAYETQGGRIESANELHLPVDATTEFALTSPDVIHSFWIPVLGGKMDAIPGRTNVLRLTPTKPGVYRGVCAEFCGASHALMAFDVVVHTKTDFAAWLAAQAMPANLIAVGTNTFLAAGCAGCHTVRGVTELGSVGPDLTHFGTRRTLAAATLPNSPDALATWLADPSAVKPGVHMPAFSMLPQAERDALVAFLMALK